MCVVFYYSDNTYASPKCFKEHISISSDYEGVIFGLLAYLLWFGVHSKSYKSLMQSKKQDLFCWYHQVLNVVNIKTVKVAFHFFLHLQIMFFTRLASLSEKMKFIQLSPGYWMGRKVDLGLARSENRQVLLWCKLVLIPEIPGWGK